MSTEDVPGANPANRDKLAMGCWAEHKDGSLIFVEGVEAGSVVYSMFDVRGALPVEFRDAMPEDGFKKTFSWKEGSKTKDLGIKWTWHDKTPFDWSKVMQKFPAGARRPSAADEMSAAARIAETLGLQAEDIRERPNLTPSQQKQAQLIGEAILGAIGTLPK